MTKPNYNLQLKRRPRKARTAVAATVLVQPAPGDGEPYTVRLIQTNAHHNAILSGLKLVQATQRRPPRPP